VTRLRALIGATLRRHRHAQQRTLREVAEAAGISLTYLSEIERGRKEASSEVLAALCDALGVVLSAVLREVADRLAQHETARAQTPVGFLPYRPQPTATPAANGTTDRTAQASQNGTTRPVAKADVIPLHDRTSGDLDEALLEAIEDLLGTQDPEATPEATGEEPTAANRRLLMTRRPHSPQTPPSGGARILDFQAHHRSRSA
jgi:transcriptional regulator with XRE-family HTH domain